MSQKLSDLYPDSDDFEELLYDARMAASSDWEERFVSGLEEKFKHYGASMFLSEDQTKKLNSIAYGEE